LQLIHSITLALRAPPRVCFSYESFPLFHFVNQVRDRWWIGQKESDDALVGRIEDLMAQIRYSPHTSIAFVGHSHFFRFLFQRYLAATADVLNSDGSPADAKDFLSQKLSNGGAVRCQLNFDGEAASITSTQLLFDTSLVD